MANVRVFGLARDLKLSSQEVIDRLKKLGVEAKTASSSVDEDTADKLRRIMKIDALTAKKSRVYGSEEDEDERDRLEREQQEKVAAERAAREAAAEEARLAAEERKSGRRRKVEPEKAADAGGTVLTHAAGAPRLAPKSTAPRIEPQALDETEEEFAEPAEVEAAPEPAPSAGPGPGPGRACAPARSAAHQRDRSSPGRPRAADRTRSTGGACPAARAADAGAGRRSGSQPRADVSSRAARRASHGATCAAATAAADCSSTAGGSAPNQPACDGHTCRRGLAVAPHDILGAGPAGHARPPGFSLRAPRAARSAAAGGPPRAAAQAWHAGRGAARRAAGLLGTAAQDQSV